MGKTGIITLLVLCLILLLLNGCMINTVTPEIDNENFGNQEDINQNSNNSQSSSTGPVEESVIEDTEEPVEEPRTVYPQQWATGDGTAKNPWANNCLNTALTNCSAGGTIFLKAGYYNLSKTLYTSDKSFNLIGEGMDKTIIVTSMTNTHGIYIETDYCTLKGFTIDGTSQINNSGSLINIHSCDYTSLEDLEVRNAGFYGICHYEANHSLSQNIYSHDNYRHGLHPGSDTTGKNRYNTYRDIYAWNNGVSGFDDRGSSTNPGEPTYNIYDNIQCWDNGSYGISIINQTDCTLTNSFVSGNSTGGIYLNDIADFNITNCLVTLNGDAAGEKGMRIISSKNLNLTDTIVKNNYSGIALSGDTSNIKFTSCQLYDDRETPLQDYALELYDTNTGLSLIYCKLTPNANNDIYNPAGAVVIIITEKMLAKF